MNGRFGAPCPSRGFPPPFRSATHFRALVAVLVAALSLAAPSSGAGSERAGDLRFLWPPAGKIVIRPCGDPREARIVGVDVILPPGAEIQAAERGVVAYAGDELKRYGHLIVIRHPHGWASVYAHTGKIRVERGEAVKRGQAIAAAPGANSVDRVPVHFELRLNGNPVDRLPEPTAIARGTGGGCSG
jgi:murein DD-endopeptidase MepM/ murein hydrolase activator NlpD